MLVPRSRSKIAAMHAVGSLGSVPMFMSKALMGHSWPPNDSEISRFVEQAVEWEWECVSMCRCGWGDARLRIATGN